MLREAKIGKYSWEAPMKEVKVYEEDIQKTYKNACEDMKMVLRCLYPGLRLGEEKEGFYKASELTAKVESYGDGLFLTIILPNGQELISSTKCMDKDNRIWVSFFKQDGIQTNNDGWNFKIRKRK